MVRHFSKYQGAKFYKCDLQMQTPMDTAHWRDPETQLSPQDTPERKAEVARQYLRRCHEVGLEIIAITDHNFAHTPSDSFITYLRQENQAIAQELKCQPLIIFPGFEMEADVGTGHHVLCIFPPETDLQIVDSRLTACGLPPDVRFGNGGKPKPSSKNLRAIIDVVQKSEQHAGLVICPHPFEAKGMLNDDNARLWLQQQEFLNPDLLCIEIPKPVESLMPGLRKLIKGGEDCMPEWRRTNPIACVQSSDCYRLTPSETEPYNFIGFRYSWIKMSEPSIEALRQAFLDHESRIRLGASSPEETQRHPIIQRVEITGAKFYQSGDLSFSSNLTCVIGGRGSGKSTLFDYTRLALDRLQENDLPTRLREEILEKIRRTLTEDGMIVVDIEKGGIPYRVEFRQRTEQRTITRLDTNESNPAWEIRTLFPIRMLSQREIDQSVDATDQTALTKLLDDFIAPQLEKLEQNAREISGEIQALDVAIANKRTGQSRRNTLITQRTEIEGQIGQMDAARPFVEQWTLLEKQHRYLVSLDKASEQLNDAVLKQFIGLFPSTPIKNALLPLSERVEDNTSEDANSEEPAHLAQSIVANLQNGLGKVVEAFKRAVEDQQVNFQRAYAERWLPLYTKGKDAYQAAREKSMEFGYDMETYHQLTQEVERLISELEQLDTDRVEIDNLENRRIQTFVFYRMNRGRSRPDL